MKPEPGTKTEWALLAGSFIVLLALLSGCGPRVEVPAIGALTPVGKIATVEAPSQNEKQNEKDLLEAQSQAEFWSCRVKVEQEQSKRLAAAERQHWLDMTCRWLMGICILGMIASGFAFAASFIWPWFERLRMAAIAGLGAAVVIFCIAWYLPTQIFWIGIAVAVFTVGGVVALFNHAHYSGKLHATESKFRTLAEQALDAVKAGAR